MKQKTISLLIMIILITITFLLLIYSSNVMEAVNFSISIWKDNLLPSLFPFFMISELLINYGFVELLGESLKKIMNKVFHLPGDASFIIIGSLISGFPSSSKYINELLEKEQINIKEAEYLLKFNQIRNVQKACGFEKLIAIYSMWSGYLSPEFDKLGRYKDLINDENVIFKKLHTGGHSEQKDLLDFIANIAPKKFVPFHTNAPEKLLEKYPNAIIGKDEVDI